MSDQNPEAPKRTYSSKSLGDANKLPSVGPSPILKGTGSHVQSPSGSSMKVVSIAEPDSISPLMRGNKKEVPPEADGHIFNLDRAMSSQTSLSARSRSAKVATRRLSGRPSTESFSSLYKHKRELSDLTASDISGHESSTTTGSRQPARRPHAYDGLLAQISEWIKAEKTRRTTSKGRRHHLRKGRNKTRHHDEDEQSVQHDRTRDSSASSEGSMALEKLQEILERSMSFSGSSVKGPKLDVPRRVASSRKLRHHSTAASEADYSEAELLVPHVDASLDNSQTLSYSGGSAENAAESEGSKPQLLRAVSSSSHRDAWRFFKYEIVRLAHTLQLKGWRRVPMEMSNHIEVERLSGALTNAVYVVSPPKDLPQKLGASTASLNSDHQPHPKNPPPKLLLRIYGQNVSHLIDRESELAILRRLARKHIGPRLLGTFTNGRFEEYLQALALTNKEMRDTDYSVQIAKRMRELHDGIDLLEEERDAGPFVYQNIDKWMHRCERIVSWMDEEIKSQTTPADGEVKSEEADLSTFVCGTPWPQFRDALNKYRAWLNEQYGGKGHVKDSLVFAHNDTQYGNILRLVPSGTSPLLLPANRHKRLVVIDFEYANANLPALEFANHFTEWCYNYHDEKRPWRCNTKLYPTREEQSRFLRAYIMHAPTLVSGDTPAGTTEPGTPLMLPASGSISSSLISSFMLDARAPLISAASSASLPTGKDFETQEDEERERLLAREVDRLTWETRLWRMVNSAQWVMWGVMQAKIPGMPAEIAAPTPRVDVREDEAGGEEGDEEAGGYFEMKPTQRKSLDAEGEERGDSITPTARGQGAETPRERQQEQHEVEENEEEQEAEDEFDYLAYARDRASFFWGDAVALGFVKREDLPAELRETIKVVEY